MVHKCKIFARRGISLEYMQKIVCNRMFFSGDAIGEFFSTLDSYLCNCINTNTTRNRLITFLGKPVCANGLAVKKD